MRRIIPGLALCATASVFLSACDDGSSDNGGVGVPPSSSMISYVGTPDVIAAWADPSTLSFSGATIGTYAGKRQMMRGDIDPMTGADLGQQAGVEMWEASDGHVYAADLTVADTAVPTPVQVSSETGATVDPACSFPGTQAGGNIDNPGVLFAPDYVTPTASAYIYRLPGADGVCNTADDVVHLVHPNTTAATAPIVGTAMPVAAVYSSQGAVTGYIAKSGASLVMLDVNLANPVVVGTFASTIQVANPMPVGLETGYPSGRLFDVDGNIVYVDYNALTTSAPLFTIPNWTPTNEQITTAASPTALWFAVNTPANGVNPASSSIYSLAADGSSVPVLASVQPGLVRQMEFPVQGTDLVASVQDLTDFAIVAIPQSQVDGSLGTTVAIGTGDAGGRFTATADDVYYTMWQSSLDSTGTITTRSAIMAGISGLDATVVQAPIANAQYLQGGEVDAWAAGDTTTQRQPFITMFLASGMTTTQTVMDNTTGHQYVAPGIAGATLSSVDPGSNTTIATLGSFPTTTTATLLDGTSRGIGHALFIDATEILSTADPATHDAYLLNSQTSATLTAATANLAQ